jgi:hypothetical protein
MDGSNLCLTHEALFARTHSRPPRHPSFDMAKAWWAGVSSRLEPGVSLFGEWLYAAHSIRYTALPGFFLAFTVRDDPTGRWWSWDETGSLAARVGAPTVPELWRGSVPNENALDDLIARLASKPSACGGAREGVVVRHLGAFDHLEKSMAKWVRKDHLQTDDDWPSGPLVRNLLALQ